MKKITAFLTALLLIPFFLPAQESSTTKKPILIDVSLGASIPLGSSYTGISNKTRDSKAGYATTGMFLSGGVVFMGKKDFGFGVKYQYQTNPFDDQADSIFIQNDTVNYLGPGGWQNHYLLADLAFSKDIKNFHIDVQALGGFIISLSDVFSLYDPSTKTSVTGTGTGLAVGINTGFGYNISPKVALKLNLGYLAGFPSYKKDLPSYVVEYKPVYEGSVIIYYEPIYNDPPEYVFKKTVSALNAGVGLMIKL